MAASDDRPVTEDSPESPVADTVEAILVAVDGDPETAAAYLAVEHERDNPRSTLVSALEKIVGQSIEDLEADNPSEESPPKGMAEDLDPAVEKLYIEHGFAHHDDDGTLVFDVPPSVIPH